MLNCARKPHKFERLECLKDKADEMEKYVRALSTLAQVSDALKTPFDDEDVLKCNGGKNGVITGLMIFKRI